LVGLLNWLLQLIHRRHSPTDGGNRLGGWWKFAEEVRSSTLGVIVVTSGRDVGQLAGARVRRIELASSLRTAPFGGVAVDGAWG